ncbi:MAG: glycosyl transferase family 2 [Candidatus Eremiobacteraeota bacterium]|jgi:glycosyltransferase involved in cell wall biosynthesis|nr:glycosyl transferase family 2 [Candidatus Eremiobacteraeota bacterium]
MLARLPSGARVFVLDAESTDDTVAVARAHGAEVETRRWTGFVTARRYALGRVLTRWALMLDADELLDETLCAAIGRTDDDVAGYRLRRMTMLCGRTVRTAGWSNERLLRLMRTDRARVAANSTGAQVHETWSVDGTVGDLPGAILHDSYPTLASYRAKFDRYTSVEAEALAPSRIGFLGAVAMMPLRFAWSLLRYGGWRDGWRGLFVAWESARYRAVVRAKALQRAR